MTHVSTGQEDRGEATLGDSTRRGKPKPGPDINE